ncbi:B12-binding domain-containing radical SAM protein [Thermopirellula anaerolimosa]
MKVLLVYPAPSVDKDRRYGYSLNLLYLAALLRGAGYAPEYVDFSLTPDAEDKLYALLPSAVAVIVEVDSFPLKRSENVCHAEKVIYDIRHKYPQTPVVACGYDCILNPRDIAGADYTYSTEPEPTIVEVINRLTQRVALDRMAIAACQLKDLDFLPFPERDLISDDMARGGPTATQSLARSALIQTSRGCPGSCTFCQRKGWQTGVRYHSHDYVVDEFRDLQSRQVVNVWVTDDNFASDLPRAKGLLQMLAESGSTHGMRIALSTWTKIDTEFLDLAKAAGVSIISLGLESAASEILEFYRKKIDQGQVRTLIEYADSIGMFTVGNFIIGAPMESEWTIEATFRLAASIPIDEVNVKILTYMPGSELFERLPDEKRAERAVFACRENGLNSFALADLRNHIRQFYAEFRKSRERRLAKKIHKHGLPYCIAQKAGRRVTP